MKFFPTVILCAALALPGFLSLGSAQTADADPATKDDVILYLRTMHSHDMMTKMMEVQSKSMQEMMRTQMEKDGSVPADFESHMKKLMDALIKGMPLDDMTQAMIPAYEKHFTHGDIAAMNAFYSSPVGQKALNELPAVTQEGMQEMMPILSKYLGQWQERMQKELTGGDQGAGKTKKTPVIEN